MLYSLGFSEDMVYGPIAWFIWSSTGMFLQLSYVPQVLNHCPVFLPTAVRKLQKTLSKFGSCRGLPKDV